MTIIADGIDLTADDGERYRRLRRIAENVLADTDPRLDARARSWIVWSFLYMCWYEGDRATTRTQRGGGPGRGLMQFEPQTLWDLIDKFVFGPTEGLIRNLALAAGVTEEEMRKVLLAFRASADARDRNAWPKGAEDPAARLEQWLLSLDSFGIKLMRYHFRRFRDHRFPPARQEDVGNDPQDDRFKTEHAEQWAAWWKRQFRGGPGESPEEERRRKVRDFADRARALDAISRQGTGAPRGQCLVPALGGLASIALVVALAKVLGASG